MCQRAALCRRELKATTSPRLDYTQEVVQPRCEFRFLRPPTFRPLARHSDKSSREEELQKKKKKGGSFPLSAERKLDITREEQEGAADCIGRGREVFNLETSEVLKPSASWGDNQHLGYR